MAKKKESPPDQKEQDRLGGEAARLKTEIRLYEKEAGPWKERSKKIVRRYKDERGTDDKTNRFNILWSNIQTLSPALYAKNPKPNVERRFQDDDDVGRFSSEVLERDTEYFIDEKFFDCMKEVVLDRLLVGRGTAWVRYLPKFTDEALEPDVSDDSPEGELYSEETVIDYIHWEDFGCNWGRTWEEVDLGWRKVFMDKDALQKRFPKIYKLIPLDHSPEKLNDEKIPDAAKKATIYEIWDKKNKKVFWIHKDYPTPLDELDDPLKLKEFWPFPRPLFATLANDTIIPVPDYAEYQDQADELDSVTARIALLTKAVKVAGVYAADAEGIQRILSEGLENRLVPVDSWAMFAEKGGLKGMIEYLPLEVIVNAIGALYKVREEIKKDLYEISGMSDIIRGEGDANETAEGVRTKGQFAALRLNAMQGDVARFCRDLVRIMAEIISTHFSFETIKDISGVQLLMAAEKKMLQMAIQAQAQPTAPPGTQSAMPTPQLLPLPPNLQKIMGDPEKLQEMMDNPTWEDVHALLANDTMRCFRIDIEVDSTIKMDQDKERQDRMDFLSAAGQFIQQAVTVQNPELMPLLFEMLMFGVRGFHVGKDLESAFKVAQNKMQKEADNPTPKPDPQIQIEQMKMQQQQSQTQADMQVEQAKAQKDAEFEASRMQADNQIETMKMSHQRDLEQAKLQHEGEKLTLQRELEYAKIQSQEKQTRAQISAKSGDGEAAADNHGLATEDGSPSKLDTIQQGQQRTMQAVGQVAQQTGQAMQQTVQMMEQQMKVLVQLAQGQKQTMQGLQHTAEGIQAAIAAINAPKKVIRDEKGRVSGVMIDAG